MDLFRNEVDNNLLPFDGVVHSYGFILRRDESKKTFEKLLEIVDWKPDMYLMFGKEIQTKREMAWYGDHNVEYTYSGRTKVALPWVPELLKIKDIIEEITGDTFNSCLLNLYHNGSEGMGWHSDDEQELGKEPVIASLSLGATRNFVFRHKISKQKVTIPLESGILLVMRGKSQEHWQHCIPKTTRIRSVRINLTFRKILR